MQGCGDTRLLLVGPAQQFELGRDRAPPCLAPVPRWAQWEFLCLSQNLKVCFFPERTSSALQGNINFPQRLPRFLSLKSWITFLSFPPVIYGWREQAFSCRSLTVYLFGQALTIRWLGRSHGVLGGEMPVPGPRGGWGRRQAGDSSPKLMG